MLKQTNLDGLSRSGIFKVNNKEIRTPFFMPVATKGAVRHVICEDLPKMNAKAIICNSLLLSLKPGAGFIHEMGGLHSFMNHPGIIFTDSGGFQVIREFCKNISDKGIKFNSPYDGKSHNLTVKSCMENQILINSDVAMALDHMPLSSYTEKQVKESMERTFLWAKECKELHDRFKEEHNSKQLLFGITQGGVNNELREKSINQLKSIDFDGFALGGLAIGEKKEDMYDTIKKNCSKLPENKIRYLMGVGHPRDIIECVKYGADCFDSVFPTQTARHNHILTKNGFIKLLNSEFTFDKGPLDSECDCFVCKNYSRAFIRYLTKVDEPVAYQLKSYHNLHWMQNFIKEIQNAIKENTFNSLYKKISEYF